jgi:deazaflavin-dependent oxidoreductase (nitroreductase family)
VVAPSEPAAHNRAALSISQRLGALVVALFAIAFTRTPSLIRLLNPVMRRLLVAPLPAGPNALLRVRGRRSGLPRDFPVAFLELDERGLLQAASRHVAWVHNLRAAREAVVIRRGHSARFGAATQLDPEIAGPLMRDLLAAFPQSRSVRAVVGRVDRPPVAILRYFRLRIDDGLDDYVDLARRQPVFELRRSAADR